LFAVWTLFDFWTQLTEAYNDRSQQRRILTAYEEKHQKQAQNGVRESNLETIYEELTNTIVNEESVADVLTRVSHTAETNHITAHTFKTGVTKYELPELSGLWRWSVDFHGEGTYTDIQKFLNAIDKDEIQFLVDGWAIHEGKPNENLTLQLDLSFYSFQDPYPRVDSYDAQFDEAS
jgi:hypothetical protein